MFVSHKELSKDNIIDGYFKNPKKFDPFIKDINSYVKESREVFFENSLTTYYLLWNEVSTPLGLSENIKFPRNLTFNTNKNTFNGVSNIFEIYKGMWVLSVTKDEFRNRYDFSINVAYSAKQNGSLIYGYHADAIEDFITARFDKNVYLNWKEEVFDDLDSLEEVVIAARKNINRIIPSITSSSRSKQLLELVDIEVRDDFAFLIPLKY